MGSRGRGPLTALTLEQRAGTGPNSLACLTGPLPCQVGPRAGPDLRSVRNASRPLGKHSPHPALQARPPCPSPMAWPGVTREPLGWHQCPHWIQGHPRPATPSDSDESMPGRGADPPPSSPLPQPWGVALRRPGQPPAHKGSEVGSCVQSWVVWCAGKWKCGVGWAGDACKCALPMDL